MLFSEPNKFVTIDIPKTGTRSLRTTLVEYGIITYIGGETLIKETSELKRIAAESVNCRMPMIFFRQHAPALSVRYNLNRLGYNWDDYYSYTVVRNPWDRYLSLFNWLVSRAKKNKKKLPGFEDEKKYKDEFCKLIKSSHTKRSSWDSQDKYILDNNGESLVDKIADFDNLQEEFDGLCQTVGLEKKKLYHLNKNQEKFTKENLFNQETIDYIYEKEKYVIDMMSYSFTF